MLFSSKYSPRLKFARIDDLKSAMWAPLLEKAWAKVRGSYESANGGFNEQGIRTMVGCPVASYNTGAIGSAAAASSMFEIIKQADILGYIMSAGTAGNGSDQERNSCGIAMSHAYAIITAFEITNKDSSDKTQMLMMRNPWDLTYYTSEYSRTDPVWNDAYYRDQVPNAIDPRTSYDEGIFFVPMSQFIGGKCFDGIQIGHYRDKEGYSTDWYDADNMDNTG